MKPLPRTRPLRLTAFLGAMIAAHVSLQGCESDDSASTVEVPGADASFDVRVPDDTRDASITDAANTTDADADAAAVPTTCIIDATTYAADAVNPSNPCEQCKPATSASAWTTRASFPLLVGGTDVTTQGWTVVATGPNTLTYGPDYVRLQTTTNGGASTSGQLILVRAGAFEANTPFTVRVELQIESVNTHNQFDSAAAILGDFTAPNGTTPQRSQMIFLDSAAIGWADNTQSVATTILGAYRTIELAVDAAKVATVKVDGVATLTRNAFAAGNLAIGDQTNDANYDSALRIRSVTKLCP